jgi:molybdate transport system permease protein
VPAVRRDGVGFVPWILVIPAVVGLAVVLLPLAGLVARVEWSTLGADLASPETLNAVLLSVVTALIATAVCVVLGVPLALLIARARPKLAVVLRVLVAIPLVLPPLVGGVGLLVLLDADSRTGQLLLQWGIVLPSTTAAVVIAQVFVAMPFLVLALEGALRFAGSDLERAAATLGARRWRILWQVTLPIAVPGLVAGVILCFARAAGEFGATLLFAGNTAGTTRTIPLAIFTAFDTGQGQAAAVVLSLLLLVVALAALLAVRAWRPGAAMNGTGSAITEGVRR